MRLAFILVLAAVLLISGCSFILEGGKDYKVSVEVPEEGIFADCPSFLVYYDACQRLYTSIPGSVCEQRYSLTNESLLKVRESDIPSSDSECYPVVECNAFMNLRGTASRLQECRPLGPATPRCILSFDIQCTGFNATSEAIYLRVKNSMASNIKQVSLSLAGPDGTQILCTDERDDAILSAGEEDTFVCKAKDGIIPLPRTRTFKATMLLAYQDYRTGTISTKTGVLEVEV